ncbi:Thylakoid associated protein, partial [Candidatus Fermentibacteria bacterium]
MVDLAGGWPRSVVPGARVLLKVNMLSAKSPERAITTHPEVVAAAAVLLKREGC